MSRAKPAVEEFPQKVNSETKQLVNDFQLLRLIPLNAFQSTKKAHLPRVFYMLKILSMVI